MEQAYIDKINYFTRFEIQNLKDAKSADEAAKKKLEGRSILESLMPQDYVVALDEHGKTMDSMEFSRFIADKISGHPHRLVFLVGGPSGLSDELDGKINMKLSFSPMTFAHDIFRIIFLEQLYRAFTIIKNIKYHR